MYHFTLLVNYALTTSLFYSPFPSPNQSNRRSHETSANFKPYNLISLSSNELHSYMQATLNSHVPLTKKNYILRTYYILVYSHLLDAKRKLRRIQYNNTKSLHQYTTTAKPLIVSLLNSLAVNSSTHHSFEFSSITSSPTSSHRLPTPYSSLPPT